MTTKDLQTDQGGCCNPPSQQTGTVSSMEMFPLYQEPTDAVSCCGPPAGPLSNPHERPGYRLCHYVEGFLFTPAGPIPKIKTRLEGPDKWGSLRMRLGAGRNSYQVSPGLYAVGEPDAQSPVLVSANYKLSFDHLRVHLSGVAAWVLVLDTRGINVWCAAGKGTFGTEEVIRQVNDTQLTQVVDHRRLILPQLGAVGVAGRALKKATGFEVVWGPVRVRDLGTFLSAGLQADEGMRRVSFNFNERVLLIPVELSMLRKYLLWAVLAAVVISGIGPRFFSFSDAWYRGWVAMGGLLAGVLAGCVLAPALLPWVPGKAFSAKGAVLGLVLGLPVAVVLAWGPNVALWSGLALVLWAVALGSFLAMTFTGATPFTSPSGVEKEMRRAIPLQLAAAVLGVGLWIGAGFGL